MLHNPLPAGTSSPSICLYHRAVFNASLLGELRIAAVPYNAPETGSGAGPAAGHLCPLHHRPGTGSCCARWRDAISAAIDVRVPRAKGWRTDVPACAGCPGIVDCALLPEAFAG